MVGYSVWDMVIVRRMYEKGDIVKFRNVVDAGDEELRMILLEDPDGGQVLVESIVVMKIRPTYRYNLEELEVCTGDYGSNSQEY